MSKPFLIADGAPGPWLAARFPKLTLPVETLNLSQGETVTQLHRAFLQAGARLVRTNTRGACRPVLARGGMGDRVESMNVMGAGLLRELTLNGPFAGSTAMGSLGQISRPAETLSQTELEKGYSEQIIYLSDSQVNILLLEHFTRLEEALMALKLAASASDAPVLVGLTLGPDGLTEDGVPPAQAAARLAAAGAGAVGVSCLPPGERLTRAVEQMAPALEQAGIPLAVLAAGHSAGSPLTPQAWLDGLEPLLAFSPAIVGGCCGVGPEHIQALASRHPSAEPPRVEEPAPPPPVSKPPA
ncbi:MAG: homocysteine S-methyltransferase family protein [Deltaproteobacteria bacterium]|nr:homocysteine S-methyltransferase family protein [Deltaproteobacteria bacterium]